MSIPIYTSVFSLLCFIGGNIGFSARKEYDTYAPKVVRMHDFQVQDGLVPKRSSTAQETFCVAELLDVIDSKRLHGLKNPKALKVLLLTVFKVGLHSELEISAAKQLTADEIHRRVSEIFSASFALNGKKFDHAFSASANEGLSRILQVLEVERAYGPLPRSLTPKIETTGRRWAAGLTATAACAAFLFSTLTRPQQRVNMRDKGIELITKQVDTGYTTSDALDDGAAFAVAGGLRADL